jgi:leucyl/phenylalanyl-tRNA--protein transferase
VTRLREQGVRLLDTQWLTSHLKQFGGFEVPRKAYHAALREALGGY